MKISWFGHSSFLFETSSGIRVITDPYSTSLKFSYSPLAVEADIVKYTALNLVQAASLQFIEAGESFVFDSIINSGVTKIVSMESLR